MLPNEMKIAYALVLPSASFISHFRHDVNHLSLIKLKLNLVNSKSEPGGDARVVCPTFSVIIIIRRKSGLASSVALPLLKSLLLDLENTAVLERLLALDPQLKEIELLVE